MSPHVRLERRRKQALHLALRASRHHCHILPWHRTMPTPCANITAVILASLLCVSQVSLIAATVVVMDPTETSATLQNAHAGWAAYRRYVENTPLKSRVRHTRHFDGEIQREQITEFLQKPQYRRQVDQIVTYKGGSKLLSSNSGLARCINPKYVFQLVKGHGKSDWSVTQWTPRSSSALYEHQRQAVNQGWEMMLTPIIIDSGIELSKLAGEQTFRIRRISSADATDEACVRIEFSNAHNVPERVSQPHELVQAGWLELSPKRQWTLSRFAIDCETTQRKYTIAGELQYDMADKVIALPSRVKGKTTFHQATDTKVKVTELSYEYENIAFRSLPSSQEFELSAFGMSNPDSDGIGRGNSRGRSGGAMFATSIGAMIAAVCVGVLARWASRGLPIRGKENDS